jgi:hypothetical protein
MIQLELLTMITHSEGLALATLKQNSPSIFLKDQLTMIVIFVCNMPLNIHNTVGSLITFFLGRYFEPFALIECNVPCDVLCRFQGRGVIPSTILDDLTSWQLDIIV